MPSPGPQLDRWMLRAAAFWLLLLTVLGFWIEQTGPAASQGVLFGLAVLIWQVSLVRVLGAGGTLADKITLARFAVLLGGTLYAWHVGRIDPTLWLILGAALLADMADGYAARKFGSTEAGALLDMETDQVATLCLALLFLACTPVGPWVLLLPAFRYAYVLAMRGLRISTADPKPCDGDNRRARLLCALMMVLLFLGLCPWLPRVAVQACAGVSVLLLAYSYGTDVVFLVRRRRLETTG